MNEDMTGVGVTQNVALDRKESRRRIQTTPRRKDVNINVSKVSMESEV